MVTCFRMAATAATDLNIILLDLVELCQSPILCYKVYKMFW